MHKGMEFFFLMQQLSLKITRLSNLQRRLHTFKMRFYFHSLHGMDIFFIFFISDPSGQRRNTYLYMYGQSGSKGAIKFWQKEKMTYLCTPQTTGD